MIVRLIKEIGDSTYDGEESPFTALSIIKGIELALKDVKAIVQEVAINEAEKFPNGKGSHDGIHFQVVNGRKMFDFSQIKEYQKKKTELKELEMLYKSAFEGYQKSINMVDKDGVLIPIPKVKYTSDYVKVSTK